MTRPHPPLAELHGGPVDGESRCCDTRRGLPPDGFLDPTCPEGRYLLVRPVWHDDGSLCGGLYQWVVQ